MLEPVAIPDPVPARKVPGYRMPDTDGSLLRWDFVATRMSQASYYWLNTARADGRPHAVPVWGIWHGERLHFDGSPQTTWARNLLRDGRIAVHPPDAERVVVIEGIARVIGDDELDGDAWRTLDMQYQRKYGVDTGSPYWCVHPTRVLAWDGVELETMTRWMFDPPS